MSCLIKSQQKNLTEYFQESISMFAIKIQKLDSRRFTSIYIFFSFMHLHLTSSFFAFVLKDGKIYGHTLIFKCLILHEYNYLALGQCACFLLHLMSFYLFCCFFNLARLLCSELFFSCEGNF